MLCAVGEPSRHPILATWRQTAEQSKQTPALALRLTLLPDGNFTVGLVPGAPEGRVAFTVLVSWSPHLRSFQPDQLLAEGQRGIANTPQVTQVRLSWGGIVLHRASLHGVADALLVYADLPALLSRWLQLSFLTYPEKLLAGSWRFLTYFGRRVGRMRLMGAHTAFCCARDAVAFICWHATCRDSLIAARLMMSRLASAATEAALGAALGELILVFFFFFFFFLLLIL